MIKAAIIGATGYAGQALLGILTRHPEVDVMHIGSRSYDGERIDRVYPLYRGTLDDTCQNLSVRELADSADVIFLALPHGIASAQIDEKVLDKTVIIDLGADYRLNDVNIYEKWYQVKHESPALLASAVYGLPELHRAEITQTNLIANPGCYTTCSILTLAPLIQAGLIDIDSVVIDAKSGVTGAGRGETLANHFCEVNENIKAYKIASHRHTPEIEQELSLLSDKEITLLFTPHLVPMNRGILSCCYAKATEDLTADKLAEVYRVFYEGEPFVRLIGSVSPETRWVKGTNLIDIGVTVDPRTRRVIAMGAIDNLYKGAAGQAVQNMNIRFGLDEKTGLDFVADFPV